MIRNCIEFSGAKGASLLVTASLMVFGYMPAAVAASDDEARGELGLVAAPNVPLAGLLRALPDHARAIAAGEARRPDGQMKPGSGCDKEIDIDSEIEAARVVGVVDTGICTNSDIDTYTDASSGKTYVVIAGGTENAWTQIDVTNPADPKLIYQAKWSGRAGKATYTPDVKTFKRTYDEVTKYYLALALERTGLTGGCGVVIVDVTDPIDPLLDTQYRGGGNGWCDTHNVFVEDDGSSGDGSYIYATADLTADLRVLEIIDGTSCGDDPDRVCVGPLVEQGVYRASNAWAVTDDNTFDDIYVHDVTVQNGIVYASYWLGGLHIFDADEIRGGVPTPSGIVNETDADVILPTYVSGEPFLVHHAYPSADDKFVFVEDEITYREGDEPVQMFDTERLLYVDGLMIDDYFGDVPVHPAHNLEVSGNRLYVGWYRAGLQAWDFVDINDDHGAGFLRVGRVGDAAPRTAGVYHQAQTKKDSDGGAYIDGPLDGAWAVRVLSLLATPESGSSKVFSTFAFQSDREFGLIIDCLADSNDSLTNCPPQFGSGDGGDDGGDDGGNVKQCNPKSPKCNN